MMSVGGMRRKRVMSVVKMEKYFVFWAEAGIRDLVRSRGLGDEYKKQQHRRSPRGLRLC